ncbi:hypothetical protein AOQ84DRAFT_333330 [Glonium stellatum]|uniref:Uncharacterized protein n=1 Tax=Glonium stellatum TaxID=574774 RepID=A0A8E2F9N3_9PEZI|nr:hypothetical protein AOQ84DRAFT_333330 [Glonium stellatum]
MDTSSRPYGAHLVGSVNLPTREDVFRKTCALLPNRLCRIPDGETGDRNFFVFFQREVFTANPVVLRQWDADYNSLPANPITPDEVVRVVEGLLTLHTGYDDCALESYATFCQLKVEGVIPARTRFQVSLPTPANVMCMIADPFQAALEPVYEEALLRALQRIQTEIPKDDLAIQWDTAAEFAALEGAYWPHFAPYFDPLKEGVIERLLRLGNAVVEGVEMGFHLCYGDIGHRHFVEPKDMGLLVEIATSILEGVKRPVTWFHMPVPKGRTDNAYFAPLEKLELGKTELYLGLVHAGDEEGTKKRIKAAQNVVQDFGVATECGLGRTPPEDFESIMQISTAVSSACF